MAAPDAIDLTGLSVMGLTLAFLFLVCAVLSFACGWERGRVRGRRDALTCLRTMRDLDRLAQKRYTQLHPERKGGDGDD